MSLEHPRIGFIGAGKMATALAQGWLAAGLFTREQCLASDPDSTIQNAFTSKTRITTTADNRSVAGQSDVLILAVKPQNMSEVLGGLRGAVRSNHLVVSIAAGISLHQLFVGLGPEPRLVRVMPNTPALVQAGAAAFAAGMNATESDVELVDRMFNAVGKAMLVTEDMLDAVTGLSGSGPAYVFTIIEALSDGGVLVGLPRNVARILAAQTVLGAAKMVLETSTHPAELRDQVTSPGGTTIAGLQALEKAGLRSALIQAVEVATHRARMLGND